MVLLYAGLGLPEQVVGWDWLWKIDLPNFHVNIGFNTVMRNMKMIHDCTAKQMCIIT